MLKAVVNLLPRTVCIAFVDEMPQYVDKYPSTKRKQESLWFGGF